MRLLASFTILLLLLSVGFTEKQSAVYDYILRGGVIYDGTGGEPFVGDLAINGDTIAAIGDLSRARGHREIDVFGYAVSPGFINMLSWADQSLAMDGRSVSGIKQGITLEVFGEGYSPRLPDETPGSRFRWTPLAEYFALMEKQEFSPNIASFVGATSIRIKEMGFTSRQPDSASIERMKRLVEEAMQHGAMGLGTSLIYPPATFTTTEELIALASVSSHYGGMYITHIRSEGEKILEALDETIRIAHEANIPAEIYHLKINLEANWSKLDAVIRKIDSAQHLGLRVTANMYPYTASATGLTARLPAWVQEGGAARMRRRLLDRAIRTKVLEELRLGTPFRNSPPEQVVLTRFQNEKFQRLYGGKNLQEIAAHYGKSPDETAIDLIIRDGSRIEALYFQQSEQVMRRIMKLPYVSFGTDAGSYSLDTVPHYLPAHPRAFGTFTRVLGKYVREERLLTLPEAVRKMTSQPARNLKLHKRGELAPGYFADVVVFHPDSVADHASYEQPHRYATGVSFVFVNGTLVLNNGEHTGAMPGRVLRGPGWGRDFY